MKWKIVNLGIRSFLGFNLKGENYLEWLELKNKCDKTVFWQDLHNFLTSKYMYDFFLLFDRRALGYGFNSSLISEDRLYTYNKYYSMARCLGLFKKNNSKYICLTIGKSTWFPNFGGSPSEKVDSFPYPALRGLKNIHIAEIHGAAIISSENGDDFLKIQNYYRISVYEVDGVELTVNRVARFENGKIIDESNLKKEENLYEVMHFSNFNDPVEYSFALHAEGIGFGLTTCCRPIAETMKKYHLSFGDAMRQSIDYGSLIMVQPDDKFRAFVKY